MDGGCKSSSSKSKRCTGCALFYYFSHLCVAKEGGQFNFEISTADLDNSSRTIKVFGLPSEGESWLKLLI